MKTSVGAAAERGAWRARGGLACSLGALALAAWGQYRVSAGATGGESLVWFIAAAAVFVAGLEWGGAAPDRKAGSSSTATVGPPGVVEARDQGPPPRHGVDLPLALGAAALAAATFVGTGDPHSPPLDFNAIWARCETTRLPAGGQFTPLNLATWLGSIALGLAACWQRRPAAGGGEAATQRWWTLYPASEQVSRPLGAGLALALAAGAFFLFYRIDAVPREMTSDHAEKLLDVQFILDGHYPVFFPCNTGREAFQFYWIALMTPLAGLTYLTMKLGTATLAWLALPCAFLFTRVLAGAGPAVLATAVMALMRWHWQVGRVGLRFPFPPLFGAATFYFLARALRDRRRNDFLLCGLVVGIAQHTYTALRFAPLAVAAGIGIALVADLWRGAPRARVRRLVVDTLLMASIAALVSMPLVRYAYDQPQAFLFRGVSRLTSDSLDAVPTHPIGVFAGNVKNALLMFNWKGDVVWVNTISGAPVLDPLGGALFVLGAAYVLYRAVRRRDVRYVLLLALFFVALLPSIMSLAYPGENPSTVRTGMAIPVVALLVALPLWTAARQAHGALGGWAGRGAGALVALLPLATMAVLNFHQYFGVYAPQHTRSSQHASVVAGEIQRFIAAGGRPEDVRIISWPHWVDRRLVAIDLGNIKLPLQAKTVAEVRAQDGSPFERLYVVHPDDRESLELLRRWYPESTQQVHRLAGAGGQPWFLTVRVPANATARLR